MKEYKDVKRAAEAALRGLIRSIYENLEEEEADKLCLEMSMSLFNTTIDYSLPFDLFMIKYDEKFKHYTIALTKQTYFAKSDYDMGLLNEDNKM